MDDKFIERLRAVILKQVQKNIKERLLLELDNRYTYTGHSLIARDIEDVKNATSNYANDEIELAIKKIHLLIGV